ncbi:methyl-accepting chemotaxis protein [Actinoplanes sichuanensis]|uniref:Methyl-accepting chemotaxis protein n=1 Tax=Actinoplanes sichuanensis TaxID=512349 RepID=A0ABW4A2U9_9ACTN
MQDLTQVSQLLTTELVAARQAVQVANAALVDRIRADVEFDRDHAATQANQAIIAVTVLGVLALACGAIIARRLNRAMRRQVGTAVGHIQSSSAQLETAAAQQANGGRDQATALAEITTTIGELLITSRQIADGAHRVSKTAEDTETAARRGDATINQTRASIAAIRTQVDQTVQHMLGLGEKSQQIESVVQLVAELAEQTNILAINATIEATGAGEQGRRFAVVADEIRKLADRTAASAKEIRTLIDEIRAAVNTTVVSTEAGAQAVDAGTRNFDEATTAFRTIAQLVSTTNDATREIELSTTQQTTAVEQVNVAAADTARVSREGETSATQTRQTAAHLAALSSDLLALVGTGRGGEPGGFPRPAYGHGASYTSARDLPAPLGSNAVTLEEADREERDTTTAGTAGCSNTYVHVRPETVAWRPSGAGYSAIGVRGLARWPGIRRRRCRGGGASWQVPWSAAGIRASGRCRSARRSAAG